MTNIIIDLTEIREIEEALIEICKEQYNETQTINLLDVYLKARQIILQSSEKIETALTNLLDNKVLIPKTFLTNENLLKHPVRRKIHGILTHISSLSLKDLQEQTEITLEEFSWHLGLLIKYGRVKEIQIPDAFIFSLAITDEKEAIISYYIKSNVAFMALFKTLINQPQSFNQLRSKVSLADAALLQILEPLIKLNVLVQQPKRKGLDNRESPDFVYTISKSYHQVIEELLIFEASFPSSLASDSAGSSLSKLESSTSSRLAKPTVPPIKSGISAEFTKNICAVHKGIIKGITYSCHECGTQYCLDCAKKLVEEQSPCWSCKNPILIDPALLTQSQSLRHEIEEFTPPLPKYTMSQDWKMRDHQIQAVTKMLTNLKDSYEKKQITQEQYEKQKEEYEDKIKPLKKEFQEIGMKYCEEINQSLRNAQEGLGYLWIRNTIDWSEIFGKKTGKIALSILDRQQLESILQHLQLAPEIIRRMGYKLGEDQIYAIAWHGPIYIKLYLIFTKNPDPYPTQKIHEFGTWLESNYTLISKGAEEIIEESLIDLFHSIQPETLMKKEYPLE